MGLNLEKKKAIVAELAGVARNAHAAIGADYSGLSVPEMTALRRSARDAGVYLRVVRNNLARRAFQDTELSCMADNLVGPFLFAFSAEDPGAAARVINDFAKTSGKLVVKLVAIDGKLLDPGDIKTLANLPTREQALSQMLAMMKAPIGQLARTLSEPHAKLVRTLAAVGDQKRATA